ncbi:MAG: hypothetical protein QXG10_03815 [Candidatus Hadarchaeales archaeon]
MGDKIACFLVPMALGIATVLLYRKFPKSLHAGWLNALLWGGTLMLMVEHIAHGEIVLYPPFLTAGLADVLPEMLSVGVPMMMVNVGIWSAMVLISSRMARKSEFASRGIGARTGVFRKKVI